MAGLNLDFPITDPTWIFLIVLVIILFAPLLLNKLKIPHIIGMILAGVLIGGHGLNILERDSSFELFGQVGLYYIMFLAGLEMDMEDFRKNKVKGLVFGLLTFFIPLLLGIWTSITQYIGVAVPLYIPLTRASTSRARVTVTAVPPIEMVTLLCLESPYRLTMG